MKKKYELFGMPMSTFSLTELEWIIADRMVDSDRRLLVTFVNPLACRLRRKFPDYSNLLRKMDVIGCDGIGMVVAARFDGANIAHRVSFDMTSLAPIVCNLAVRNKVTVALVGGRSGVADTASQVLKQRFPGLDVQAMFSGYEEGPEVAMEEILKKRIRLVVVGMGAPLQERFLVNLANSGWSGVGITCGGFLDQVAQGIQYYPEWVDRANLRFAYRLYKEPLRMGRRYFVDYQPFIMDTLKLCARKFHRALTDVDRKIDGT